MKVVVSNYSMASDELCSKLLRLVGHSAILTYNLHFGRSLLLSRDHPNLGRAYLAFYL